jgi:hypothetical protein
MRGGAVAQREQVAALLERAYRMALLLQGHACAAGAGSAEDPAHSFEQVAMTAELVALLDDARAALLEAGRVR